MASHKKPDIDALLDNARKANSAAVRDEYIRQAEDTLAEMKDDLVTRRGKMITLSRKYEVFHGEAGRLEAAVERLNNLEQAGLVVAAQSRYNSKAALAQEYKEQYEKQQVEALKLDTEISRIQDAINILRAKR